MLRFHLSRTLQDLEVPLLHQGEKDEAHLLFHVVVAFLHGNGQGNIAECASNLLQVFICSL